MAGSKQLVNVGPRFTPLRWGLLAAAQEITADDDQAHWQHGTIFQIDVCGVPAVVTGAPCRATSITKSPTVTGLGSSSAEPFSVYAWINCAPIGHGDDLRDLVDRTTQLLTNGEARAVENVFWGPQGVRPHLASNAQVMDPDGAHGAMTIELQSAATTLTSAAVDVVEALGLLEASLASCYGGEGIIHVPAQALAHLDAYSLVTPNGAMLRTRYGNKVAVYSSNNRQGPTGVAPAAGQGWMYATGNVAFRRTGVKDRGRLPASFVGRADNSTVYVVERTYVLDWDCCHFAAQVSLAGPTSGAVGA